MNIKSGKEAYRSHLNNPDREQNKDITEVLNMKESLQQLTDSVNDNPSESLIDYNKKIQIMLEYKNKMYFDSLENILTDSYIELNVYNISLRKIFYLFVEISV